jgi:hypothetical protein
VSAKTDGEHRLDDYEAWDAVQTLTVIHREICHSVSLLPSRPRFGERAIKNVAGK